MSDTQNLINALVEVRATHQSLSGPAWEGCLPDAEAAAGVQHAVGVRLGWWSESEVPRHWKSGGASRSAALTHAPIPLVAVRTSPAGQSADLSDWPVWLPRVEGEIALRVARDITPDQARALSPEASVDTLAALFDAACAAMEIVDSRWQAQPQASALLRLADFQSNGALVLGDWQPVDAAHDWATQACTLFIGDDAPVPVVGTHPLGHPFWGMPAWLQHLTRHGATVPAGTVVTTGTWTGIRPVTRGATLRFEAAGFAPVTCRL